MVRLAKVLDTLEKHGFLLKRRKVTCFAEQIEIFGLHVDLKTQCISPSMEKFEAILNRNRPEDRTQLKSFLGSCAWNSIFLINHVPYTAKLHAMTILNNPFIWDEEKLIAYEFILKQFSRRDIFINLPRSDLEFAIAVDSSEFAIGYTLFQIDIYNKIYVLAYGSHILSTAQSRLASIEREALGVILSVRNFFPMIQGKKTILYNDSRTSIFLAAHSNSNSKVSRWNTFLNSLDWLQIKWLSGQDPLLKLADYLSRKPGSRMASWKNKKVTENDMTNIDFVSTKLKRNTTMTMKSHKYILDWLLALPVNKLNHIKNHSVSINDQGTLEYYISPSWQTTMILEEMSKDDSIKTEDYHKCNNPINTAAPETLNRTSDPISKTPNKEPTKKTASLMEYNCNNTKTFDVVNKANINMNQLNSYSNNCQNTLKGNEKYILKLNIRMNHKLSITDTDHIEICNPCCFSIITRSKSKKLLNSLNEENIPNMQQGLQTPAYEDINTGRKISNKVEPENTIPQTPLKVDKRKTEIVSDIVNLPKLHIPRGLVPPEIIAEHNLLGDTQYTPNMEENNYDKTYSTWLSNSADPGTDTHNFLIFIKAQMPGLQLDKLKGKQIEDPRLKTIIDKCEQTEDKIYFENEKITFFLVGGVLCRQIKSKPIIRYQLCIPEHESFNLIIKLHRQSKSKGWQRLQGLSGHPGAAKLTGLVAKNFYIYKLSEKCKNIINSCFICQGCKPPTVSKRPTYRKVTHNLTAAGEIWYCDCLQITQNENLWGFNSLLVLTDAYSHYTCAYPIFGSLTQNNFLKILFLYHLPKEGRPKGILTDNASNLSGKLVKSVALQLNIAFYTSCAYSPKSNMAELLNRMIIAQLKITHENYFIPKRFWHLTLASTLININYLPFSTPNGMHCGLSPAVLHFGAGHNSSHPDELGDYPLLKDYNTSDTEKILEYATKSNIILSQLREMHRREREEKIPKTGYGPADTFNKEKDFKPGDVVSILRPPIAGTKYKLRTRATGEFIVVHTTKSACYLRPFETNSLETWNFAANKIYKGNHGQIPLPTYKVDKSRLIPTRSLNLWNTNKKCNADDFILEMPNLANTFYGEITDEDAILEENPQTWREEMIEMGLDPDLETQEDEESQSNQNKIGIIKPILKGKHNTKINKKLSQIAGYKIFPDNTKNVTFNTEQKSTQKMFRNFRYYKNPLDYKNKYFNILNKCDMKLIGYIHNSPKGNISIPKHNVFDRQCDCSLCILQISNCRQKPCTQCIPQ